MLLLISFMFTLFLVSIKIFFWIFIWMIKIGIKVFTISLKAMWYMCGGFLFCGRRKRRNASIGDGIIAGLVLSSFFD